jgi:ubiquinone/menaquinone biosynthesis C-methylase UbiE
MQESKTQLSQESNPDRFATRLPRQQAREIVEYYEETGLDYGTWSKDYNMHFGYWRKGLNPFRREPMLVEMNKQVIRRLPVHDLDGHVFDLGCGLGATMRTYAKIYPERQITGVTLVPWQIQKAEELNQKSGVAEQINIIHADFLDMPLPSNHVEGAYALESCCHSPGVDKAAFILELHRILKPAAKCVIVDGFTKVPRSQFNTMLRFCLDETCKGWALPCFPELRPFLQALDKTGFEVDQLKDLSWRIAPSAIHAPFCVAGFIFSRWWKGERLNKVRLGHLKSCLLGLILGISRRKFGYYMITVHKKDCSN